MYEATVSRPDGRVYSTQKRTALECAVWADEISKDWFTRQTLAQVLGYDRPTDGSISVTIEEVKE